MAQLPYGLFATLVFLLILSAFFSSSETAYSSVNKIRLRNYAEEGRRGSKKAVYIADNFDQALSTILVGNNIVNIAAATISAQLFVDLFGESTGLVLSTVVMTILVLIFGEILPKSFAKENPEFFSLQISGTLFLLMKVFYPITIIFVKIKEWASKLVSQKGDQPTVTEEEIKVMVELSEEEGLIDKKERELVHRSLDFNDILVGEVLKPRIDMIAIDIEKSIEEIKQTFLEERFSRIPVYEGNVDNIIGILSEREFLGQLVQSKEIDVRKLIRLPMFVVESMKIATLLPELQKNKVHMAIVIDEFGGTSGLITMEDILEELVGEIWDEHDEKIRSMTKIDQENYELSADLSLDEFVRYLKVADPDSSFKTLGGWIVHQFERIPDEGEQLEYENLIITIGKVENRRIRKVLVKINEVEERE